MIFFLFLSRFTNTLRHTSTQVFSYKLSLLSQNVLLIQVFQMHVRAVIGQIR